MTLSDKFLELWDQRETNPDIVKSIAELVENAPESSEREGLRALMYHDGIAYPIDLDKSFELAEEAAFHGRDALGYYLLGYMCDNAETPDQEYGGPRQKYDHYDAVRFYEKCAEIESPWKTSAVLWLGEYYIDFAKGGDPEIGAEYYESIGDNNAEAAGKLSDYYWNLVMLSYTEDKEWLSKLYKWTEVAARLNPEEYSSRLDYLQANGFV